MKQKLYECMEMNRCCDAGARSGMRINKHEMVQQFKNKEWYGNTGMKNVRLNNFSVTGTNKLALINLVK